MRANVINDIILTQEQSKELIRNLVRPQREIIEKRDTFLADVNEFEWEQKSAHSFSVEIPNLDLSFVKAESNLVFHIVQEVVFEKKAYDNYVNLYDEVELEITTNKNVLANNIEGEFYDAAAKEEIEFKIQTVCWDMQAA